MIELYVGHFDIQHIRLCLYIYIHIYRHIYIHIYIFESTLTLSFPHQGEGNFSTKLIILSASKGRKLLMIYIQRLIVILLLWTSVINLLIDTLPFSFKEYNCIYMYTCFINFINLLDLFS